MKKLFTLIAAAMMAVAASAQTWKASNATYAEGANIFDSSVKYITGSFANTATVTPQEIVDDMGEATPITSGAFTFTHKIGMRVTDAPSKTSPTGTLHTNESTGIDNAALVIETTMMSRDVIIYCKKSATKPLICYSQTTDETLPGTEEIIDEAIGLHKITFQLPEKTKCTFYQKGGTVELYAIDLMMGTYVVPTSKIYANASAAVVDGFSTISYGDGAKLVLNGNSSKNYGSASSLTIDGKTYATTKVSNGAQNTFYAPAGKKIYGVTLYSYVNKDAATERTPYWKEVNGVTYDVTVDPSVEHKSYKDGANPDVFKYFFLPDGVDSFTFTNAGEQACFVIEAEYDKDKATAVPSVEAAEATPSAVKAIKNGQLVIVKGAAEYNVAGAQVK